MVAAGHYCLSRGGDRDSDLRSFARKHDSSVSNDSCRKRLVTPSFSSCGSGHRFRGESELFSGESNLTFAWRGGGRKKLRGFGGLLGKEANMKDSLSLLFSFNLFSSFIYLQMFFFQITVLLLHSKWLLTIKAKPTKKKKCLIRSDSTYY